jgi:hypothetical protein
VHDVYISEANGMCIEHLQRTVAPKIFRKPKPAPVAQAVEPMVSVLEVGDGGGNNQNGGGGGGLS